VTISATQFTTLLFVARHHVVITMLKSFVTISIRLRRCSLRPKLPPQLLIPTVPCSATRDKRTAILTSVSTQLSQFHEVSTASDLFSRPSNHLVTILNNHSSRALKGKVEMHFSESTQVPPTSNNTHRGPFTTVGRGWVPVDSDNVDSIFVVPLDVKRMRPQRRCFANPQTDEQSKNLNSSPSLDQQSKSGATSLPYLSTNAGKVTNEMIDWEIGKSETLEYVGCTNVLMSTSDSRIYSSADNQL
jgi:hypothetical protein